MEELELILNKLNNILKLNNIDESIYKTELNSIKQIIENLNINYGLYWELKEDEIQQDINHKKIILNNIEQYNINNREEINLNNIHTLIEGENLISLNYLINNNNKYELIALDPPYNLSKDFSYNDNRLNKSDKYKHSEWLNFMYIRLKLAHQLLTEDGIIYIHIDETEQAQLKLLLDYIFGENNFISKLSWFKGYGKNNSQFFSNSTEYIYFYAKNIKILKEKNIKFRVVKDGYYEVKSIVHKLRNKPITEIEKAVREYYNKHPELKGIISYNKVEEGSLKLYASHKLAKPDNKGYHYEIIHPITKQPVKKPKNGYNRPEYSMNKLIEDNLVIFGNNHTYTPRKKAYLDDCKYNVPKDLIVNLDRGGSDLIKLIGHNQFSYPKPVSLVKYLINLYPSKHIKILDFFAGSGTTGQAVLELNKEDDGERIFTLCTNNENNICQDITYQRLKTVFENYNDSLLYYIINLD